MGNPRDNWTRRNLISNGSKLIFDDGWFAETPDVNTQNDMKEISTEPLTLSFSLYDFYKTYSEMITMTQDYIDYLENIVVEDVPKPTINEFKFLR